MKAVSGLCELCVYYPPNLPASAYSSEDYALLQSKSCSYDFDAGSDACQQMRKTSCSIVDMKNLPSAN